MNNKLSSIKILGTSITNAPKQEVLEYIIKGLEAKSDKFYIVTPNPEILMYAFKHKEYQEVLNDAQVSLPDGIGVLVSGRLLKKHIIGRITGVDMMQELCCQASKRGLTVGFLGGKGNVAEKTSLCLQKKYPELIVNFAGEEWNNNFSGPASSFLPASAPDSDEQLRAVGSLPTTVTQKRFSVSPVSKFQLPTTNPHIDLLFVAFGFPKQEEWIAKNLESLPITCAMGVGGAFDYISGKVPRAPKFMRKIGMEWAYRLARQPWRLKRQLVLPQFAIEVLKEKIGR
jgi:N-acetylglucosaminyldiphosphoundecaprenol N-acetyl-beta-D-mannosaminyltransferase